MYKLLPLLALWAVPAEAQVTFAIHSGIGFSRGDMEKNVSELDFPTGGYPSPRHVLYLRENTKSFLFGVSADRPLTGQFSVRPELAYQRSGHSTLYVEFYGDPFKQTRREYAGVDVTSTHSITAPVLLSYLVPGAPYMDVAVEAGPYVGLVVQQQTTCSPDRIASFCEVTADQRIHAPERVDAGVVGGLSVTVGRVGIGARYSVGLINAAEISAETIEARVRNRSISVTARVRISK